VHIKGMRGNVDGNDVNGLLKQLEDYNN